MLAHGNLSMQSSTFATKPTTYSTSDACSSFARADVATSLTARGTFHFASSTFATSAIPATALATTTCSSIRLHHGSHWPAASIRRHELHQPVHQLAPCMRL